jgi:hypothetical protein
LASPRARRVALGFCEGRRFVVSDCPNVMWFIRLYGDTHFRHLLIRGLELLTLFERTPSCWLADADALVYSLGR